jgi:hypothetical protein
LRPTSAHIGQKPTNPLNSVIAPNPTKTHPVRVAHCAPEPS